VTRGEQEFEFNDESFSVLLPAAREGSVQARNELFRQLQSYLAWVAHREFDPQLKNKLGESDLVQQSYVRAVECFQDFHGNNQQQLMAWLGEILTNEARQARRSFSTDKRNLQRERSFVGRDHRGQEYDIEPTDSSPTPGTQALANERSAAVVAAMQNLSADHRQVIELRNWQQMSFAGIAEQMQRSENAVTKLWFRALLQLQDNLESDDESQ